MGMASVSRAARATCAGSVLATQRLPLVKARPGPPWPTGPDPDAGQGLLDLVGGGVDDGHGAVCRLATQTSPAADGHRHRVGPDRDGGRQW